MRFFEELKRRNVFRVGVAYAVTGWLLAQAADVFLENFGAPDWLIRSFLLIILLGFPLVLIFAWAFELTPEGLKREKDVDRSQSAASVSGRKLDRAIIGILVLALGWFVWDKFVQEPTISVPPEMPAHSAQTKPTGADSPEAAPDKSVAVLPFTTRSNSEEDQFFSDGMHDDLLTQLSKIGSLKVISRTSVMEYRDTTKNLRQIGRELGAASILEGAVQRAGNQVRINVQLIDADTDEHLWAETYDRVLSIDNLFAMQSEMARSIASALQATLSPNEQAAIGQPLTDNLEALESYRRAKLLSRYFIADELQRAESEIRHALELDPEFTGAWALLAYIKMAQYWGVEQSEAGRDEAWRAIERGREINPDLTELDIMEGYYHYWGFLDYPAALRVLEPLLSDNRNNADLVQVTAWVNRRAGNWSKALELLHQAELLTPRNLRLVYSIGETYAVLRDWDQAQAYLDKAAALDPAHSRTLQLQGDIVAGRDGDFVAGARFLGLAKQDQGFLTWQHLEMLLRANNYEGALEAANSIDQNLESKAEPERGMATGLTQRYFGEMETAQSTLEPIKQRLEHMIDQSGADLGLYFSLCRANAGLGLTEAARETCAIARNAMRNDAMRTSSRMTAFGVALAWAGADEEAMKYLMAAAETGQGYSHHWYTTDRRLTRLQGRDDWEIFINTLKRSE